MMSVQPGSHMGRGDEENCYVLLCNGARRARDALCVKFVKCVNTVDC